MKILIKCILLAVISTFVNSTRTVLNLGTDFPFDGTIPRTQRGLQYEVDITTVPPGDLISLRFQVITPSLLTSMFLAVSQDDDKYKNDQFSVKNLYGVNYTQLDGQIDVANLQLGKMQYINRKKIGAGIDDKLYLTVYYLDPSYRKVNANFRIHLQTMPSAGVMVPCYPCVNGRGRRFPGSLNCMCNVCDPGYYGPDCSISVLTVANGQPSSTVINGPGMAFFFIDEPNQLTILVKQSDGIGEIYFNFITFEGEFASFTNVAEGRSLQGRFLSSAGTGGTSFGAVSTGTRMSVTVAIYDTTTTSVEVSYLVQQKSNILLIVLSVLGGVLFIGLVIAGIYIVRNSRWFQGQREGRQIRPASQNLSDQQIERFFPTVLLKNINLSQGEQSSSAKLNQNANSPSKLKINIEDCVICLCPIEMQQQIKVTYCKHIFHSQCLVGWFKKQQNCPYCREQFMKSNTVKLYKKVKQSSNGSILKGQQLINAIIESKNHIIPSKDSLESLQQKQPQRIQVAHRSQVQIQNLS